MTRTLTLYALFLTVTCAAYAAGLRSPDGAPRAVSAAAPWVPMSFDIETSPPEEAYPSDERTARAFEQ